MIVEMRKVYVVARNDDQQPLLDALGKLGVIHLTPLDAQKAIEEEKIATEIDQYAKAIQILGSIIPTGELDSTNPADAAAETLQIHRDAAVLRSKLNMLLRRHHELEIWGNVTLEQFEQLTKAGITPAFYTMPRLDAENLDAECVSIIGNTGGKDNVLVAMVNRSGEPELPDSAEPVELPKQDRPAIKAEAAEIDAQLKRNDQRLPQLACFVSAMEKKLTSLREKADYLAAGRGGLTDDKLFAIQGWSPADKAETLGADLASDGLHVAVELIAPAEDEQPPTLIRYPRWTRPIKALFDILGTFPGYREYDVSAFFMIALPLFAAMLIGDAGYGLIFLTLPMLFYRKVVTDAAKQQLKLMMTIGAVTLVWGVMSANYFGITPESLALSGGYTKLDEKGNKTPNFDAMSHGTDISARVGNTMASLGVLWVPEPEKPRTPEEKKQPQPWNVREVLMAICFVLGCIHLVAAKLRRIVAMFPDQRWLAEAGWCLILAAMLGIIWIMFFSKKTQFAELMPTGIVFGLLAVGGVLALLFTSPSRNPVKRIGVGFAASLLPLLGAFSDTMSYIRLMAVGLASYYIASAFNGLGVMLADSITWYAVLPIVVILFGHALNIGLAMIAIFAHGVRLNMLEFSNNAGIQWTGYPYEPFAKQQIKES